MNILFRKLMVFVIPFLLWVALLILIDPFNYFNVSHIVSEEIKKKTSYNINSRLYKSVEFRRNPTLNILLGDSRTNEMDVSIIADKTGQRYFNFSHGGGSLPEIVSTFNYANSLARLSNVYIGINFNLYNANNSTDMFSGAAAIAKDYKFYLFNRSVAEGCFLNIISTLSNKDLKIGLPPMDREAFWRYLLDYSASFFYKKYKYPAGFYSQLKDMAGYCKTNNINLIFFIPPTHVDLQKRVADFGLVDAQARFKEDLATLGTVYDFDYPNDWTQKRENFNDPFHFNHRIMEEMIDEIWGNKHRIAVVCGDSMR